MEEKELTGYASIDKPWENTEPKLAFEQYDPEVAKRSCWEVFYEKCSSKPNLIAFEYYGKEIYNYELLTEMDKASRAFQSIGMQKDDLVFMLCINMPEVAYCMYSLNRIGAVTEWFNPTAISAELLRKYIIESDVRYIVAIDLMYGVLAKAIEGTSVEKVILLSVQDSFSSKMRAAYNVQVYGTDALLRLIPQKIKARKRLEQYAVEQKIKAKASYRKAKCKDPKFVRWPDFVKSGNTNIPIHEVPYEHGRMTFIIHTGGTTGPVKRVAQSDYAINSTAYQTTLTPMEFKDGMISLHIIPPIVGLGLVVYHIERFFNLKACLVSTYDKNEFVPLIKKHRPNVIICTPSFLGEINDKNPQLHADDDLSCLKLEVHGGENFPVRLDMEVDETLRRHGSTLKTQTGFGQNEEFGWFTFNVAGENKVYGSCGIPLPGDSFVIYDLDEKKELPYGMDCEGKPYIGELLVSGPTMMLGYVGSDAKENEKTFIEVNGRIYIDTGDQGYIDENGRLWYVTRNKRIIRTQEGKIFTNVIESMIDQIDEVYESCVVAIPDDEKVKAASCHIVLRENVFADEACRESAIKSIVEKIDAETGKMYSYYVPAIYQFRSTHLPRTAFGKIDFMVLEKENSDLYDGCKGQMMSRIMVE